MSTNRYGPHALIRLGLTGSLLALGVFAAVAVGGPALAQGAPALRASFTPRTIGITPGGTRKAVLLLANRSSARLIGLTVTFTSDPGIEVTVTRARHRLPAGGSEAVVASVTRSPGAPATAAVEATIRYTSIAGRSSTRGAAVAGLAITTAVAAAPAMGPIAVSASIGTAQLIEYQSTDAFFTITNDSDQEQQLTSVVVTYPAFLTVEYLPARGMKVNRSGDSLVIANVGELAPGNGTVVHLHIGATQPLQPGGALLVLTVSARGQADNMLTTTFASQKLSLSVLGESGVLQLLGVPSLLFVPGIVFVMVLWALWRFVAPRTSFSLSPGSGIEGRVAIWVFALLPSLAFPFLYPIVTGLVLGQRRDYRTAYGLDDILYVWIMAATFAVLLWLIAVLGSWLVRWLWVPAAADLPRQLLRKYAWRPRPWQRKLTRETALCDGQQLTVILRERGATALVSPQIKYHNNSLTDPNVTKLNTYIPDKPLRLYRFLRRHRPEVTLTYEPRVPLDSPASIDQSRLTGRAEGNLIVEGQ
jgi:hypothetical protein